MLKKIFFFLHLLFIFLTFFLILFYWQILILQFMVILSWKYNNNNCLVTQLEDYIFNTTITEYIENEVFMNNRIIRNKYRVPWEHRLLLYIFFTFGLIYYVFII